MRLLVLARNFPPQTGGIPRLQGELARHLPASEVHVSTVAHPQAPAYDATQGYPIARLPVAVPADRHLLNQLRWARDTVRAARDGVDVILCGNLRPTGFAAWWAHRRTGVPYLLWTYGTDVIGEGEKARKSAWRRRSTRDIYEGAAGIIAISDWTARLTQDGMRAVGVRRAPEIRIVPLGTDPTIFSPAKDTRALRARLGLGDGPLLLTVASLVPHKGHDVAIRALARLAGELPALRYLVVGTGAHEATLRALAAELGVADRVVFAGGLADTDVVEAYATATLYVGLSRLHARYVEGFGISFVEAAASGLPSVAGDSGGVRSAVVDGESGVIVPPEDLDAATAAIGGLLRDEPRRAALARRARALAETHFNWARVARDVRAFAADVARRA